MKLSFRTWKRVATVGLPIVFLVALIVHRFTNFASYSYLIQEDGLLESFQFAGYLGASLALAFTAWSQWRVKPVFDDESRLGAKIWASILMLSAIFILLVAGEEVSWGQRFQDLKTPEYFATHNVQNELTIHNLDTVQPYLEMSYLVLGLVLGLSWVVVNTFHWVLSKVAPGAINAAKTLQKMVPRWDLLGYFLPISIIYAILNFYKPFGIILDNGIPLMIGRDQELGETLLALGILIHSLRFSKAFLPNLKLKALQKVSVIDDNVNRFFGV